MTVVMIVRQQVCWWIASWWYIKPRDCGRACIHSPWHQLRRRTDYRAHLGRSKEYSVRPVVSATSVNINHQKQGNTEEKCTAILSLSCTKVTKFRLSITRGYSYISKDIVPTYIIMPKIKRNHLTNKIRLAHRFQPRFQLCAQPHRKRAHPPQLRGLCQEHMLSDFGHFMTFVEKEMK